MLGGNYDLMRQRADLELLFKQAQPLFDQERETIAEFLASLSTLVVKIENDSILRHEVESVVLLGQRVMHELTEIGL